VGQKKYAQHECGEGRKLVLSRDSSGYSAWCFRCNDSGWAPGPKLSLAERVAEARRAAAADESVGRSCRLPEPSDMLVTRWPLDARVWLHKAGLGAAEIARLGAYYHPPTNRVVLPVYEAGELVFWQARSIDKRLPKYLSPPVDRSTLLPRYGSAEQIVLTEDLLSAFKVGLVGEAWCLMGTYANARLIAGLLERKAPVAIWLDPDAPGRKAAAKVRKQLSAYGIAARVIRSDRDPKFHTFDQIKECIR
jgi:DNA primase